MNKIEQYKRGIKCGLSIGLGYLSVSFAFGMMAVNSSIPLHMAVLMSLTNLTSAGQFAAISIIVQNLSLVEMFLTQLTINLRYALMSLSLSQKLDPNISLPKRMLMAFANTDEIFVIASREKQVKYYFFLGLITTPIIGWTFGTFLGGYATNLMSESLKSALGIALYAMFIAIIIPPAKHDKNVLFVLLISICLSSLLYYLDFFSFIGSGFSIIIVTLISAAIMAYIKPVEEL